MIREQVYCVIDYETFSEADLKKVGAYEYSVHPSTEIICAAWRIGTRKQLRAAPTNTWISPVCVPKDLIDVFNDPSICLVAHNAYFEQVITTNVVGYIVLPMRWICTASLAATLALPRNLEGAALAMKLPIQKDMDGRRLILKWCKPRKPSLKNPKTRHDDPEELARLVEYCKTDVATEVELFLKAPMLTRFEREVWKFDQMINLRGFQVDRPLIETILEMIEEETAWINKETKKVTNGAIWSTTQRDRVLAYVRDKGVDIPDLRKGTVDLMLKAPLPRDVKTILEHRAAISKTSTAKYQAFERRSRSDGRVRDILMYHAASTGRWGGVGVQPQNLPRATIKDTDQAASIIAGGDLELIRMIYGKPMNVFSDCIRSVIVPSKGRILDVADYAAIEARVLFWVARHEEGLKAFREGRDLYREQASRVFNKPVDQIESGSLERFVGKGLILGCGYQMGWEKFQATCELQGQKISDGLAQAAVQSYRETNRPVVKLWEMISRASLAAVSNLGKRYSINRTTWFVKDDFLFCELPSGRRLAYAYPSVKFELPRWGGLIKIPVLYHWAVDPLSKKWTEVKTYGGKLTENVVQAIARDLMAAAMLRIEPRGPWKIILSVHDELIAERELKYKGFNIEDFCAHMAELPDWAEGCPVVATGWSGMRYRK